MEPPTPESSLVPKRHLCGPAASSPPVALPSVLVPVTAVASAQDAVPASALVQAQPAASEQVAVPPSPVARALVARAPQTRPASAVMPASAKVRASAVHASLLWLATDRNQARVDHTWRSVALHDAGVLLEFRAASRLGAVGSPSDPHSSNPRGSVSETPRGHGTRVWRGVAVEANFSNRRTGARATCLLAATLLCGRCVVCNCPRWRTFRQSETQLAELRIRLWTVGAVGE